MAGAVKGINSREVFSGLHDKNSFKLRLDTDGDVTLFVRDGWQNKDVRIDIPREGLEYMRDFANFVLNPEPEEDD